MTIARSNFLALLTAVSLVAPLAAMVAPMSALAQQQRPPEPPFAEMATALGVSEAAVKSCFPAPSKDQGKPGRPDAAKITTCLQAENTSLTKDEVEQTLGKFAPKPPKG